jgi:hypothetical protein
VIAASAASVPSGTGCASSSSFPRCPCRLTTTPRS